MTRTIKVLRIFFLDKTYTLYNNRLIKLIKSQIYFQRANTLGTGISIIRKTVKHPNGYILS